MTWERTAEARSSAPPGDVWRVLADGRRWSDWFEDVDWMVPEGDLAPGTIVTVKPRRMRQTAFHVEAAEPGRVLALIVTFGPAARLRLRWDLRPDGGGTAIVHTVAVGGPLAALLRTTAARIAGAMPAALTRLAERAAASAH